MYVTSHARHAMRMGWSEASLSPGRAALSDGREGEREGKQQAGMKVQKPSLVKKEPTKTKNGDTKRKQQRNKKYLCFVRPHSYALRMKSFNFLITNR